MNEPRNPTPSATPSPSATRMVPPPRAAPGRLAISYLSVVRVPGRTFRRSSRRGPLSVSPASVTGCGLPSPIRRPGAPMRGTPSSAPPLPKVHRFRGPTEDRQRQKARSWFEEYVAPTGAGQSWQKRSTGRSERDELDSGRNSLIRLTAYYLWQHAGEPTGRKRRVLVCVLARLCTRQGTIGAQCARAATKTVMKTQ